MPPNGDIAFNPVTKDALQGVSPKAVDTMQFEEAARKTIDSGITGFVPLANRRLGWLKLGAFHVANFLTAGGIGQFAYGLSQSQVMGSQKRDSLWQQHNPFRDLGETYLNATQGKTWEETKHNRKAARGWTTGLSEGAGAITGIYMKPFTAYAAYNNRQRTKRAFAANFQQQFGRPPCPEAMKNMSTERLFELGHRRTADSWKKAQNDFKDIQKAKAASGDGEGLDINDIDQSSDTLKAHFAAHLADEFSLELLYFKDWAEKAVGKLDGADGALKDPAVLADPQNNYQLSKIDVLAGYTNLIQEGSPHEINIDHTNRKNWTALYNDNGLRDFHRRWNKTIQRRNDCRKELAAIDADDVDDREAKKLELVWLECDLEAMRSEKFDPQTSRKFAREMQASYDHSAKLLNAASNRFALALDKDRPGSDCDPYPSGGALY